MNDVFIVKQAKLGLHKENKINVKIKITLAKAMRF